MVLFIKLITKGIGSGIGLASESIKHHKAKKAEKKHYQTLAKAAATPHLENPKGKAVLVDPKHVEKHTPEDEDDSSSSDEEGDEEAWQLDEATAPFEESESEGPHKDVITLTTEFLQNQPPPAYTQIRAQLPCPVILPQRRPRDKKRGFVRAYAPVLEDVGIDQATFLDFLKTFKKACEADGWLQAVNLAAFAAGFVPNPIAMGVTTAVQFAVGVAMEVQRLTRTNSFLDRMNEEFFKPRGLYCLIMTYKPDSTASHTRVDINQTIATYSTPASNTARQTLRNLRTSSGKTYGELELPESAPLIFPALEKVAKTPAKKNPNSKLVVPGSKPEFMSRYSDPNHAANNGSIVSLLTGGKVNPWAHKEEKRLARRQRRAMKRGEPMPTSGARRQRKGGLVKRVLTKDVLYLMIVNLPTEAETAAGRQAVANEAKQ
ncbi:hypothetical protein ONS95_005901 [Cadophora gregata]|uniref:uncharacterized protein n=1 Tax=Cadophora gregata TaxID=51156 RepID=UPI0026DCEB2C|nr:uncharacterized protein ONS95_005901 [Cadophora gregata]KAK0102279.1 hypothetical protein ONS95_005901 [Cadophora gregata]